MGSIFRGLERAAWVAAVVLLVGGAPAAWAQLSSELTGTVEDASTGKPLAEVVVVATSSALQGERTAVTDSSGLYRLSQLPPGSYTLRFEREDYRPYARGDLLLRLSHTVRHNAQLLPEALEASETLTVVGRPPAIDVGSSRTGVSVGQEAMEALAFRPRAAGAATRSFESLAELAPGAKVDTYGVSLGGTSSPENAFMIDGLSVGSPVFGPLITPLSLEFIQEANVITGGFMPEFGRSAGGIISAVTRSGSNELHGSVFGYLTPGLLEASPTPLRSQSSVIHTTERLWNQGDFGATLGGPILKDKLWFFAGVAPALTRRQLTRNLQRFRLGENGEELRDELGFLLTEPLPGTERTYFADQRVLQYIGKLTWQVLPDHTLTLASYGVPGTSGGPGRFGYNVTSNAVDVRNITGTYEALARRYESNVHDVSLKLTSSFLDKHLLLDAMVGWHHIDFFVLPSDGSRPGTSEGLMGVPHFVMQRNSPPYSITDFEAVPDPSACAPVVTSEGRTVLPCRLAEYRLGGPGTYANSAYERYQANTTATLLFQALGHHVLKAGVELDLTENRSHNGFTGGSVYAEDTRGQYFRDLFGYGYLRGPDSPVRLDSVRGASRSAVVGGFLQDSWSLLDKVTLNLGLRYDAQSIFNGQGRQVLSLPHQLAPRVGLVYDFTQQGRSKLFANYARYYQNLLLILPLLHFSDTPVLRGYYNREPTASGPGCDPLTQPAPYAECRHPGNLRLLPGSRPTDISRRFEQLSAINSPVDPQLQPQSSDEFVVGGEYEVLESTLLGVSYTHRSLLNAVEDMSRNELASFFIGNPGQGLGSAFPRAEREYDAVSLYLTRSFAAGWLAQASYTWSSLRGNYPGLFRPGNPQLNPITTLDFNLLSLMDNVQGPLPGDNNHLVKLYGAGELALRPDVRLQLGVGYQGQSGAPINVLGAHYAYGPGFVLILPRGSGGRLPWVHSVDTRLALHWKLAGGMSATFNLDVLNLPNFQAVTEVDEVWTADVVESVPGGTLADIEGDQLKRRGSSTAAIKNPNYGNPTAYQAPRSVRLGMRLAF